MHAQLTSIATPACVRRGGYAMRDANDTMTADIPGVQPLPPKPARVTIAERRLICGYQDPRAVRTCRNCRHRVGTTHNPDSYAESVAHRCGLHNFPVALGGICVDQEK